MRRDSSYSSGVKTEDSLGCACVGPPGDDATAHRTWDHGRRSSSSCSSTTPLLPHPLHSTTLVTRHQSKNPQDGSCGTDCPHALPPVNSAVVRHRSLCVFPVSGRAHPARQPSRTPLWARNVVLWGTDAPTCPPPNAGRRRGTGSVVGHHCGAAYVPVCHRGAVFGAEPRCGADQTIMRQCGASSEAAHRRGAVNVHVRRRGAIFGAKRHHGAGQTALRQRGASSVAECHRGAANVSVRHRGAIFRAERHRGIPQKALDGPVPTWRHFSDRAPPCCSQRTRAPS